MYRFSLFRHKEALYRISSDREDICKEGIREARREIEEYIRRRPEFASSLEPLQPLEPLEHPLRSAPVKTPEKRTGETPDTVRRMIRASELTGTGPMAAVAGAIAETAGRKARAAGARRAVIENGGDLYLGNLGESCPLDDEPQGRGNGPGLSGDTSITVGLYAGPDSPLTGRIALKLTSSMLPAGLCSSSSRMGHSLSFGRCDLATVYADDTAVADACATLACNLIRSETDMEEAMNRILGIEGVRGILCVLGDKLGMAGVTPELTPLRDGDIVSKVTRHERSGFRS
jgi:hypothetical protein